MNPLFFWTVKVLQGSSGSLEIFEILYAIFLFKGIYILHWDIFKSH